MVSSKPPTQQEIAERCGVSKMTVALVLGTAARHEDSQKRVSEATREKIHEAAKTLGYRPNRQAQLLRGARSGIIGYLSSTTFVSSSIKLGNYISRAVREAGYKVYSTQVMSDPEELDEDLHAMLDLHVEGIFVQGTTGARLVRSRKLMDACRKSQTPLVLLTSAPTSQAPVIGFDERSGSYDLTRHVLESGARSLAYMTLMTEEEEDTAYYRFSDRSRLDGFRDACREAGLQEDNVRILRQPPPRQASEHYEAGHLVGQKLAKEGLTLPDAIICYNDPCAVGLIGGLQEHGIQVPADIRVAGFGDSAVGRYFGVPLTTARLPLKKVAEQAVKTLTSSIREPGSAQDHPSIALPCEVVPRQSTVFPER